MRRFFFPLQDASIYQQQPNTQAGLDEILDVGKSQFGQYIIRSLLQFDLSSVSSSITSVVSSSIPFSASFDLKLFLANAELLKLSQSVYLYPLSSSWEEGQGYLYQEPYTETDGTTWLQRSTGSLWVNTGSDFVLSPASFQNSEKPIGDLTFDVTAFIQSWLSGTLPNNGFLIKFPDADEQDITNAGKMSFFSGDTHTVFLPTLIAKWNDSTYSTGSLTAAPTTGLSVYPANLRRTYKQSEIVRIDVVARPQYPLKTFTNQFTLYDTQYLPSSSYYSVVDAQSKETVIPFDSCSIISVDTNSNFFNMAIERMFPGRYYKLMFKVITDGYEYIFDEDYVFTVAY